MRSARAACTGATSNLILAGDLLNQCIGSFLASMHADVPYLGQYGACSTMAQGLALGGVLVEAGAAARLSVSASSHFCSAERQYRFPLAYGGQRTPTAQWTATAAGAAVLGAEGASDVCLTHVLFGKMVELGVKDANNMGAAMAPAACDTLSCLLRELGAQPTDFDCIVTGDLGRVGADLLLTLLREDGIDLSPVYSDCGILLFGDYTGRSCRRVRLRLLGGCTVRTASARYARGEDTPHDIRRDRRDDEPDLGAAVTADRRNLSRSRAGKERRDELLERILGRRRDLCDLSDLHRQHQTDARPYSGRRSSCSAYFCRPSASISRLSTIAGAGATVPLLGFGYSLAKGVAKAVAESGLHRRVYRRRDRCGRRHRRRHHLRLSVRADRETEI